MFLKITCYDRCEIHCNKFSMTYVLHENFMKKKKKIMTKHHQLNMDTEKPDYNSDICHKGHL